MTSALPPLTDTTATRLTLHRLARDVLESEQVAANGDYRLDVTGAGFSTRWFEGADRIRRRTRVEGGELIRETATEGTGAVREPISGEFDPAAAAVLYAWWELGAEVLGQIAAVYGLRSSAIVLYPEHFDVASTLELGAPGNLNLGFSPGDDFCSVPYVYAGPWDQREGPFWNASFGAYRRYDDVDPVQAVTATRAFLEAAIREFEASAPGSSGPGA